MRLTIDQVRTLLLGATGLAALRQQPATKPDVLATIQQMGVLQIDTIHVVARSPYLVLWSRLGEYQPRWLDELLAERAIFEYWSHEASFLPAEAYPLYRSLILQRATNKLRYAHEWIDSNRAMADHVLAQARERGSVRSSDFARTDGQQGGWWNWKAEKIALEMLFWTGDLMIARRHNFQRIYAPRELVMGGWDDAQALGPQDVRRALALAAVRALGVAPARWVADYFRTSKRDTPQVVRQLADEGLLITAQVDGWGEPAYIHPDRRSLAEQAQSGALTPSLTTLLSPFDPLVWDRARALELFGFDYRIECYTPAPKRRYGYFTLPILWRGQLIGRLDPKAHRREGLLEIKAIHLEPGVALSDELARDLAAALRACAAWHATPEVVVRWSDPPELAALIMREVAAMEGRQS
jgi:uncharacterized protein